MTEDYYGTKRTTAWPLAADQTVVLFAGMGGACDGLEAAGLPVHLAIDHDPIAIAAHRARHPHTRHIQTDITDVDPVVATGGRPVGVLWASPDCRHFSRAKGAAPVSDAVRSLPWVVCDWAERVHPRVIFVENVWELTTWGPLLPDGQPDPERRGETFRAWLARLAAAGYTVEYRRLCCADYGVPTTRTRLFLVARRDGLPIVWPAPTHAPRDRAAAAGLKPWRAAADIIDWSLPCSSIFDRRRPLADATLRRIARGLVRYVIESPEPFLAPMMPTGQGEPARVADFLSKHYSGAAGHAAPIDTVTAVDHHSLVAAYLVKLRGTCRDGQSVRDPLATVSASGTHLGLVAAMLTLYYGQGGQDSDCRDPLGTVTTKARHAVVTVTIDGTTYAVADIGLRMLMADEAAAAHGFAPGRLPTEVEIDGVWRRLTTEQRMRLVGNSVPPAMAQMLARANSAGAIG